MALHFEAVVNAPTVDTPAALSGSLPAPAPAPTRRFGLVGTSGKWTNQLPASWKDILRELPSLGKVSARTQSRAAALETDGRYGRASFAGNEGVMNGTGINLRLFLDTWQAGFAFAELRADGARRGLQFVGADGQLLHEITTDDLGALDAFVRRFADGPRTPFQPIPTVSTPLTPALADVRAFRRRWDTMRNTGEFADLLAEFRFSRLRALQIAGPERARLIDPTSVTSFLETLVGEGQPFTTMIGNPGVSHVHTGSFSVLETMPEGLTLTDGSARLHLALGDVGSAWVVRKPSESGPVLSVEVFDTAGTPSLLLFGARGSRAGESVRWLDLVAGLR